MTYNYLVSTFSTRVSCRIPSLDPVSRRSSTTGAGRPNHLKASVIFRSSLGKRHHTAVGVIVTIWFDFIYGELRNTDPLQREATDISSQEIFGLSWNVLFICENTLNVRPLGIMSSEYMQTESKPLAVCERITRLITAGGNDLWEESNSPRNCLSTYCLFLTDYDKKLP